MGKMDNLEEANLIVGGDFNIRLGEEGGLVDSGEKEKYGKKRASKDKVVGNGGNRMLEFLSNKGWTIANGNIEGDEEGEFTYIGARGSTVIDYVIFNERASEKVKSFRVEERIESDHAPISVELDVGKGGNSVKEVEKGGGITNKMKEIYSWEGEDREIFRKKTEEIEEGKDDISVKSRWEKIKRWVRWVDKTAVKKKIRKKNWKLGKKGWWDRSCSRKKRRVKRKLREWRRGIVGKEGYLRERKEWRDLCQEKEREARGEVLIE